MSRGYRKFSDLKRRKATRPSYDRILIVCEGSKTEPQYFSDIRREFRLPSAFIRVIHSAAGTEPRQIVDFAEKTFRLSGGFDRVYAVFDRDNHRTYSDAIAQASKLNGSLRNDERQPVIFEAIVSVPCFELWLLLHYDNIQAHFHRNEIYQKLEVHIAGYAKGMARIYETTKSNLPIAIERGSTLKARFSRLPGTEAYTDVQDLVEHLRTLLNAKVAV